MLRCGQWVPVLAGIRPSAHDPRGKATIRRHVVKKPTRESGKDPGDETVQSELLPATSSELRQLYDESVRAVFFAKGQQWKTLGSTLLVFLVLIVIARMMPPESGVAYYLALLVFVITPAAIYIVLIYQLWQHTEKQKQDAISAHFSALFRQIRAIKSTREADFHRYTLFLFMVTMLIIGGAVAHGAISALVP
jgi:hypothetical protein